LYEHSDLILSFVMETMTYFHNLSMIDKCLIKLFIQTWLDHICVPFDWLNDFILFFLLTSDGWGQLRINSPFGRNMQSYLSIYTPHFLWFFCLQTLFFCGRYFTVLVNISAFISKLFSLAWPLFTWHSFVLWAMKMMLGTTAIAWKLGPMAGN
jgi:hypothetical protein